MFLQSRLFILAFALVAVLGGQLFGVRGGLICKCGVYTVPVRGLECTAEECHDAAGHEEHHHGTAGGAHEDEDSETHRHHQPERLDFKVVNGLPGPVELPPVFLAEALPFAFDFAGVADVPAAGTLRLTRLSRWRAGLEASCASQPLVVAEFTVLLI